MFKTVAVLLYLLNVVIAVSPSDFKGSQSVQKSVSKLITKVKENIKEAKDVIGKFPATQDAGITVNINADLPVKPSYILLIDQGRYILRIRYGN